MPKSKNLPIYRVSYELLSLVTELIRHFARDFRPSLGNRLHNEAVLLVLPVDNKLTRAFAHPGDM